MFCPLSTPHPFSACKTSWPRVVEVYVPMKVLRHFAHQVLRLLQEPGLHAHLAEDAQLYAATWSGDVMAERLENHYASLLYQRNRQYTFSRRLPTSLSNSPLAQPSPPRLPQMGQRGLNPQKRD